MNAELLHRVDVISSAAELGPASWAELAQGASIYGSYVWIRWCEASPAHTAVHLVLRDGHGRPLAVLPAFLWSGGGASPNTWYDPHSVFIAPREPEAERHAGWLPLMLLGSCAGYRSEILFAPGLTPAARARIAAELIAAARRVAEAEKATLAAMYIPAGATELLAEAVALGAHLTPTSAQATIQIGAGGLDGHVTRLGRNRRRTIQREIRDFAGAGHRLDTVRLSEAWPIAGGLLGGLLRKYGERDSETAVMEYFASQVAFFDDLSTMLVEYDGDTPVGFCLAYEHHDTLYMRATGFRAGAAPFAYFNLVFYRGIELASERGLRVVDLGTAAYDAKCARGAQLEELWSAVLAPGGLPETQLAALEQPASEAIAAYSADPACFAALDEVVRAGRPVTAGAVAGR